MPAIKEIINWDCRETAKAYVNTAAVLAGFAFTAIVLILDNSHPPDSKLLYLKDWVSIALLLGFFGCIVATFTFSVVAGEGDVTPTTYAIMFLGGGGLVLSGCYLFWGIVLLVQLFASTNVTLMARWIFYVATSLSALYLLLAAVDSTIAFGRSKTPRLSKAVWRKLIGASLGPVLVSLICKGLFPTWSDDFSGSFDLLVYVSLFLISAGGVISIWRLNVKQALTLSANVSACWLFLHAVILAFLILIQPRIA
jgi:hypothetical protein